VSLGTGAATLNAISTSNSTATGHAVSVSGVSVNIANINASTAGATRASVGDGATVTAGSLALTATGTETPKASNSFTGVSLGIGIGDANVTTTDTSTVATFVGTEAGNGSPTSVTTTGAGGVTATATNNSTVWSDASFLSISLLVDGQFTTSTATNTARAKSWIGTGASVATGSFDLAFNAVATVAVLAHGSGVGAGTFSAGTTNATATLNPEVGAFTVGAGSVTGRNATFLSRVNADASGNKATPVGYDIPASATVTLGTIALIGGSGANLIAHDQP